MQEDKIRTIAESLRLVADKGGSESTKNARKQAVGSFLRLCSDRLVDSCEITEPLLVEWIVRMLAEGYTLKTASYYLKVLSAVYTDAFGASGVFSNVRAKLKRVPEATAFESVDLSALKRTVGRLCADVDANSLIENIALYAILAGGLSSLEIAELRRDSAMSEVAVLDDIRLKYERPRALRLFPLRQSDRSAKAIARELDLRIASLLTRYGLKGGADALWVAAALGEGMSPSTILGVLGHWPESMSIFELVEPETLSDDDRQGVIELVAEALTDNPYHWFAMQLRPGADYEQVVALAGFDADNVYYPSREVTRRVGHRRVVSTKPFLPGIVFFRTRLSEMSSLFRLIGSMAWPYRLTPSPTSPYAVISPLEMRAFQLAVGVLPTETATPTDLRPGDMVEFIGGDFAGLTARLQSMTPNLYRLLLPALNGIPWQIDADPRLLRPHP